MPDKKIAKSQKILSLGDLFIRERGADLGLPLL
jgi:hypothetical protein